MFVVCTVLSSKEGSCLPLRHECQTLRWRTDRELYAPCCFGVRQCNISDLRRDGIWSTICRVGEDKCNSRDAKEDSNSLHLCTQAHCWQLKHGAASGGQAEQAACINENQRMWVSYVWLAPCSADLQDSLELGTHNGNRSCREASFYFKLATKTFLARKSYIPLVTVESASEGKVPVPMGECLLAVGWRL